MESAKRSGACAEYSHRGAQSPSGYRHPSSGANSKQTAHPKRLRTRLLWAGCNSWLPSRENRQHRGVRRLLRGSESPQDPLQRAAGAWGRPSRGLVSGASTIWLSLRAFNNGCAELFSFRIISFRIIGASARVKPHHIFFAGTTLPISLA